MWVNSRDYFAWVIMKGIFCVGDHEGAYCSMPMDDCGMLMRTNISFSKNCCQGFVCKYFFWVNTWDYFAWVIMKGGLIAQCQWMNATGGRQLKIASSGLACFLILIIQFQFENSNKRSQAGSEFRLIRTIRSIPNQFEIKSNVKL